MKKIIKLTDKKLNQIIRNVIKEQTEDQVTSNGPAPEEITGSPENENATPDYNEFIDISKTLLSQGVTIGELVDKLLEARDIDGSEETEDLSNEFDPGSPIPSDNQ